MWMAWSPSDQGSRTTEVNNYLKNVLFFLAWGVRGPLKLISSIEKYPKKSGYKAENNIT